MKIDGQFSITKGYGNDQRAKLFSVSHPHKQKGKDYFVYTIFVRRFCRLICFVGDR